MAANQLIAGKWIQIAPQVEPFSCYECNGEPVKAARMSNPFRIETERGWVYYAPDDWLIINQHGLMSACVSILFQGRYKRIDEAW